MDVRRYAVFSDSVDGGNLAGVVLDAGSMSAVHMQAVAAEVGYSETAFVVGTISHEAPVPVRYFAPEAEVPFCGHATVATAAAIGADIGPGRYEFDTAIGSITVEAGAAPAPGAARFGSFDSAPVGYEELAPERLDDLLSALGWTPGDLRPDWTPGIGTAGNKHPVLVVADVATLARLDYDFERLQRLCREHSWITVQLVTPTGDHSWRARDPFPWGGVIEDPATGSAAAAFAGYLTHHDRMHEGDELTIDQGVEMQRPSRIQLTKLADRARVAGPATLIGVESDRA